MFGDLVAQLEGMTEEEIKQAYNKTVKLLGVSLVAGFSVAYLILFRNYSKALEKHHSLTELLYNPNARVAAGEKAKSILKYLQSKDN